MLINIHVQDSIPPYFTSMYDTMHQKDSVLVNVQWSYKSNSTNSLNIGITTKSTRSRKESMCWVDDEF